MKNYWLTDFILELNYGIKDKYPLLWRDAVHQNHYMGSKHFYAQGSKIIITFGGEFQFILHYLFFTFVFSFKILQRTWAEGEYDTFGHGAIHGLVLGVFVIIPISITGLLYNERSWSNMMINAGYWLMSLPLMGGIVDAMNHF